MRRRFGVPILENSFSNLPSTSFPIFCVTLRLLGCVCEVCETDRPALRKKFHEHNGILGTTIDELVAAAGSADMKNIVIGGRLVDASLIRLSPGQSLRGENRDASIAFRADADGVQLSADNSVRGLRLYAAPERRAIFNDTD
jgi:hypothetical protein